MSVEKPVAASIGLAGLFRGVMRNAWLPDGHDHVNFP
jgi:hypothetical protein